jgi:hypothetical protein
LEIDDLILGNWENNCKEKRGEKFDINFLQFFIWGNSRKTYLDYKIVKFVHRFPFKKSISI